MESQDKESKYPLIDYINGEAGLKEAFINAYKTAWSKSQEEAESFYTTQKTYLNSFLLDAYKERKEDSRSRNNLDRVTKQSLYVAFLNIAVTNLSINPSERAIAYIKAQTVKIADNKYEQKAVLIRSVWGNLDEKIRAGQVAYCENPVVLYFDDNPSIINTIDGETITYEKKMIKGKSQSDDEIAIVYVYMVMPNGEKRLTYMDRNAIDKLLEIVKKQKQNKGELPYTYADNMASMLQTKVVGRALKYMSSVKKEKQNTGITYEEDFEPETSEIEITETPDITAINPTAETDATDETDKSVEDDMPF